MKTVFVKPADIKRHWYLIDAENQTLGKVAVKAAVLARGKHKPLYTPHQEVGDYVVIINAEKALLSGNKRSDKLYYRHSGYPGGIKMENYETLVARKPTMPLEKAVKGMLPKGPLGNRLFKNVKIYDGPSHPHLAQNPELIEV